LEPFKKPIKVTQPLLPDPYEFDQKIREIWDSRQLSNCGRMAAQLESALARFLHAEALSIYANGTLALQIACRLMDLTGEVITTPFTFPATVNALYWNNLTPVFCDIEEETYNLDPDLLEPLITEKTTAIMPVHVFGNPCDTEKIQRIADRHGLKVIYDAAHAFGVRSSGKPISSFGDITMFSFHATKVYHTIEGGALVFNDPCIKARADRMKNFGLMPDGGITEPGTNAKLNEVQAAVGLLLLDKIEEEIQKRKEVTADYTAMLSDVPGIRILKPRGGIVYNYPYFVITVDENAFGISRDALYDRLKRHNILARRYFYPLSSNLECYRDLPSSGKSRLPAANKAADSVLALPLYGDLSHEETAYICMVIRESGPPDGARTAEPLPRP
jgi:dTDP-4-amino-4,6-dideoxygalactose transaminase